MRSRLLLCVIFLMAARLTSSAQSFQADFSEKYGMFSGVINSVPVKDGWLMIKESYDKAKLYQDVTILKLLLVNSKMGVIKEAEIPVTNNKFMNVKGLYKANGVVVLVYAYKMARADKEYFIAAKKINENELSAGPEISLGAYGSRYGNNTPDIRFNYSVDSSKYFLFNEPIQKEKDNKQFSYKVLGNDLTTLHQRTIELDAQSRYAKIKSTSMDKDANVYVEYRVYDKSVEDEEMLDEDGKIPDYQTTIKRYSKDGKEIVLTPDLAGNFLHTARLLCDKKGRLHIAGTFKPEKKGRLKGVFFGIYDAGSNQISALKMKEFPSDILEMFDNDNLGKREGKNAGISANFNPVNFLERANGTVDLVLEYYTIDERRVQSGRDQFAKVYDLICGAVLSVNAGQDGVMIFTRIPKKQKAEGVLQNLSNVSYAIGNKLVFLYNDNSDNPGREITRKPEEVENFRKSVLVAAIVDEKGNVDRQVIYEHNDDKYVTIVRATRRVTANSFFILKRKTGAFLNFENTKFGILTISRL